MKPVAAWDQVFICKQTNKQNLTCELYQIHLLPANLLNAPRRCIQNICEEKLKIIFNIKHQNLHNKTDDVTRNHDCTPDSPVTVYPTVINKTDTDFSNEQLSVLNKGMQYNLHKKTDWLTNFTVQLNLPLIVYLTVTAI